MHITKRLPRETGRDYALRTLRDNIIRLELAPGSMVSENELAAELGLSRTPVREALIELSKVRIVEILPQRGSFVSLIDYKLVEESQFMRKTLECAVAELDCAAATQEDMEKLDADVRLQSFYLENGCAQDVLLGLDDKFHKRLFDIAEKPQIYALMQNIAIHFDRVRSITLSAVQPSNMISDHGEIAAAVRLRDPAAARACMERHLDRYRVAEKAVREKYPDYFK